MKKNKITNPEIFYYVLYSSCIGVASGLLINGIVASLSTFLASHVMGCCIIHIAFNIDKDEK